MATIQVEVVLKGVDIEVDVEFSPGWFKAGNRRGHPDNWEEDEGESAEIESVTLHLHSGRSIEVTNRLAASQIERIQKRCDGYKDEPCYEPDDRDDYDDPRDYNVDAGTDNYGRDREYFRSHPNE